MITKHSLFKEIIDFTEFVLIFLGIFFLTTFINNTKIQALTTGITTTIYFLFCHKETIIN